ALTQRAAGLPDSRPAPIDAASSSTRRTYRPRPPCTPAMFRQGTPALGLSASACRPVSRRSPAQPQEDPARSGGTTNPNTHRPIRPADEIYNAKLQECRFVGPQLQL